MPASEELFSHISHQLRSPFTAIFGFTTILLDGLAGELNPEQREYLQIVLKNIRELQTMVEGVLDVTRLQTGALQVERQRVSIADVVTESLSAVEIAATAKRLSLSSAVAADMPSAYADPALVRHVLMHLLANAIEYTPGPGAVRVLARVVEEDAALLVVEVSDTGCGLGPDQTGRVFEPFFQALDLVETSRRSLGLGLFISRQLIERQGGTMWVTSDPQQPGSTFSFTLPASAPGPIDDLHYHA
jgi:signal transduction histidine kinase